MDTRELKVQVPEGYVIDKENSTFECIKFKPVQKRWRDSTDHKLVGYLIDSESEIDEIKLEQKYYNFPSNYRIFATYKQAKSALAMARISQIIANDKRFGGPITDEEWNMQHVAKYVIYRFEDGIITNECICEYRFLAFHRLEQRDLFLEENKDLVKQYLML